LCIRSYFDAYHGYPGVMLFDLVADPHEQHDQAEDHPEVIAHALSVMGEWGADALGRSARAIDPLWTVLHEGGPWHARVDIEWYLERLRTTGRSAWADYFAEGPGPSTGVAEQAFLNPSTPSELH
jgi:hypothetical protein